MPSTRAASTSCLASAPTGRSATWPRRPTTRSSTRPYPGDEEGDGHVAEDMDGDGRVLTMRVPDRNGNWKIYEPEPRLLVPRLPEEDEPGPYYRLVREGRIRNYDGVTIVGAPSRYGLDLNRNYPFDWRPEPDQEGAGPYPTSEPEVRAAVAAIVERPNICAFIQLHTMSGVHLRPYGTKGDDALPNIDRLAFEAIGAKATELTGYPAVSVFHGYRYNRKRIETGMAVDWAYDHLGIHSWATELWNPQRAAGITDMRFPDWGISHPVADDLKLLAWSDRELGGRAFLDWYPFEHPQFGPVELGGWDIPYFWTNPPPHLMEPEIAPHSEFALHHALISPRLMIREVETSHVEGDVWGVRVVVENTGWLPINVTQRAAERGLVRQVEATIEIPANVAAEVLGPARLRLGQLGGRFLKNSMIFTFGATSDSTSDRAKAEWLIRAPSETRLAVCQRRPKIDPPAADEK